MAAGRAVLPDGEKTRQEPCRFLSRVRFAREILRRSFGVDGVDQAVERLRRKDLGEKNEKLVVCANGVERVVRALPERDLGNVSARLGGIHAGLLVVLHARDRAGNAATVNVVALADLAPRGGEAGVDVTGHDGADGDAEGTQLVGKRHGVGVDGSLGGRVIRLKGNGDRGRHGAEIYDPAATGLRMMGITARFMFTMPKKLTSKRDLASAVEVNSMAPEMPKPALFTRMSMRPSASMTCATAARTESSEVTSAAI